MDKIYTPAKFARMLNVTVKTLQRWDRTGVLVANRSMTNRRYYTQSQYNDYFGISEDNPKRKSVMYCRVSDRSQKDDLVNQIEFIKNYAINNGIEIDEIVTDIGSGLNYNRENWNKLIDDCLEGNISTIYVSYQDRFVRFGFDWFARFLSSRCDVKIVVINNITTSPESDLIQDLISIIHEFSYRIYGLRKYKKKIEKDDSIG